MPTSMNAEQFDRWRRGRKRWTLLLDTSEALLMAVTGLWGCQLVFIASRGATEPVSQSLRQAWPLVPLPLHGIGLLLVAVLHVAGMLFDNGKLRRGMILAQMLFFLYALWSFILARLWIPGVWILPVYVFACVVNYFSLLKPALPRSQETEKPCKPDK